MELKEVFWQNVYNIHAYNSLSYAEIARRIPNGSAGSIRTQVGLKPNSYIDHVYNIALATNKPLSLLFSNDFTESALKSNERYPRTSDEAIICFWHNIKMELKIQNTDIKGIERTMKMVVREIGYSPQNKHLIQCRGRVSLRFIEKISKYCNKPAYTFFIIRNHNNNL